MKRHALFWFSLFTLTTALNAVGPETVTPPTADTPENTGPTTPDRVLPNEAPRRKNYWIPALEIPLFQFALNAADRQIYDEETYGTTFASGWDHVNHGPWVVDQDDFSVNQIGHPYQGSMYYGFARSSGLNFWEGWLYSNVGSFVWETYGENSDPSINDQVASGTGGALLGEPLFRIASLVLEQDEENPSVWRKLQAALISPPMVLNRLVFGAEYTPVLEKRNPATLSRTQLGGGNSSLRNSGDADAINNATGSLLYSMDYGMPGRPGYKYLRPFDYFHFDVSAQGADRRHYENVSTRGLLFGQKYESGSVYRGIWGLYGNFDYLAPHLFRTSMTGASLGTTGQWWLSKDVALQATTLGGLAYGAAGTVSPDPAEPDYHYGATPQTLIALRFIFGKRLMLDTTARGFYITNTGASKAPGTDRIGVIDSSLIMRIVGHHALGVHYTINARQARYDSGVQRDQIIKTVIVAYNYLSDLRFGAVEWGR